MSDHEKGQVATSAAAIYDEFFVPALFAEWPSKLIRACGVNEGDEVLDVACGTGVLALRLEEAVGSDGSVVAVDINEGMLEVARSKSQDILWRSGRAEELPFEDGSFDCVLSQFGLMFFEDRVRALREMRRVLRARGNACVAVWASLESTPGYLAVREMLLELFGAEVARSIEAPYALGDKSRLLDLFIEAEISSAAIQTDDGQAVFDSLESWIYTDIRGWTLADVVDDAGFERIKLAAPDFLADFVNDDGTVSFDAPAHIVTFIR